MRRSVRRSGSPSRSVRSRRRTVRSADGAGSTTGAARRASLAFVLDSTWALPMTAARPGVAGDRRRAGPTRLRRVAQPPPESSGVPSGGSCRGSGFAITVGNVVSGAGDIVAAPSAPPRHRSRGRPRVAGALVRSALPGAVRRVAARRAVRSARSCGRCVAAPSGSRRWSSRAPTTSTRSSGGPTAATTTGRRRARSAASAGATPSSVPADVTDPGWAGLS